MVPLVLAELLSWLPLSASAPWTVSPRFALPHSSRPALSCACFIGCLSHSLLCTRLMPLSAGPP